jgi:hypothetical protein
MKSSLGDYIKSAFNARPMGMFIPPNWIGLAGFGLLGILNPGFWLIGAGLEMAYLFSLSTNPRFQRFVSGSRSLEQQRERMSQVRSQVAELAPEDQRRYMLLEQRCQQIIEQQRGQGGDVLSPDLQAQSESLGRLLWIFLRLLVTRRSIQRLLLESAAASADRVPLAARVRQLEEQVKQESLSEEMRKSLTGQLEILQQRMQSQRDARQKLDFLDAELTRIQEQVELIREQAVFNTDPATVSQRIDQIAATLGGTQQWIREQQQLYGRMEDLLTEPPSVLPPVADATPVKQAQ